LLSFAIVLEACLLVLLLYWPSAVRRARRRAGELISPIVPVLLPSKPPSRWTWLIAIVNAGWMLSLLRSNAPLGLSLAAIGITAICALVAIWSIRQVRPRALEIRSRGLVYSDAFLAWDTIKSLDWLNDQPGQVRLRVRSKFQQTEFRLLQTAQREIAEALGERTATVNR